MDNIPKKSKKATRLNNILVWVILDDQKIIGSIKYSGKEYYYYNQDKVGFLDKDLDVSSLMKNNQIEPD